MPHGSFVPPMTPCSFFPVFLCFGHTIPPALKCELPKTMTLMKHARTGPSDTFRHSSPFSYDTQDQGAMATGKVINLPQQCKREFFPPLSEALFCLFSVPCSSWLSNAIAALLHKSGSIYILGLFQETHKINTIIWWFRHWPSTKPRTMLYLLCVRYLSKFSSFC